MSGVNTYQKLACENYPKIAKYFRLKQFFKYFSIGDEDDCWEWTGSLGTRGYGQFHYKGNQGAHQASYIFFVGRIRSRLYVCHSCDNPKCVNPKHLWLGTHKQNMDDRNKKHRQVKGELVHLSKLTEDDVKEIRKKYLTGKYSCEKLGRKFNVAKSTIARVVNNSTWKSETIQ